MPRKKKKIRNYITLCYKETFIPLSNNQDHAESAFELSKSLFDCQGWGSYAGWCLISFTNLLHPTWKVIVNKSSHMLIVSAIAGNIRVFCRIRPISMGENFGRLRPVIAKDSSNVLLKLADNKSKNYSFDKVFHPGSSQGAWISTTSLCDFISFMYSPEIKSRRIMSHQLELYGYKLWNEFYGCNFSDEVFSEVEPVIKSVLDGYNACIFAYGQTGTGKSFTMVRTLRYGNRIK